MVERIDVGAALSRVRVSTPAELLAAGATQWQVRTRLKVDDLTGVRASASAEIAAVYRRIAAVAHAIAPDAVIAGWTGALVHGVDTAFIDGTTDGHGQLPLCVNPRGTQTQRKGVLFTYSRLDADDIEFRHGMLVTTGVRTTFDCMRLAPTPRRALALGDACIRFGLTTVGELADYVKCHAGWKGIGLVRKVIPLLSPFAESPMESVMRYVWIDCGLPKPWVNPRIFAPSGAFVARVDLLDPVSGLIGEYNGQWHQKGLQPWADTRRQRAVQRLAFTVAVVGGPDFGSGGDAAGVLREEYLRAQSAGPRPLGVRIVPQEE